MSLFLIHQNIICVSLFLSYSPLLLSPPPIWGEVKMFEKATLDGRVVYEQDGCQGIEGQTIDVTIWEHDLIVARHNPQTFKM